MKGELGILACPLSLALCLVALLTFAGGDAGAATTHVDGDWYMNDDTTLSNGTWVVNGSVYVEGCHLTLDGAELFLQSTSVYQLGVHVASDARLTARNSEMWGEPYDIYLEVSGDTHLSNTSIHEMGLYTGSGGIRHEGGTLTLDHCDLDLAYYTIISNGDLTVRSCRFTNFTQNAIWWSSSSESMDRTLVIEDSVFVNTRSYFHGTGIEAVQGGPSGDESTVSITGCHFNGLSVAMSVGDFELNGHLLVEGNRVENCSSGIHMSNLGPRGVVRGNQWNVSSSGTAFQLDASDTGSPDINNETVTGGSYGIYVSGSYDRVSLRDMHVTGVRYALYCYSGYVDIHDSHIRSSSYNFWISRGHVHLHGCDHQYTALVGSYYGEVSEPVIVNVTQVTWQEGTPIEDGVIEFVNETGEHITERDNENPSPVTLATWMRTYRDNITIERVRGLYSRDGLEFSSGTFEVSGLASMELVIIDNSTPEVEVTFPRAEDRFEAISLTLKGNYTERGVGMGAVKVSHDGEEWLAATLFDDGKWQVRFPDLPDGILTFAVNISDRAGNSMEVTVPNITIDTIWPFIQVKLPGRYVPSSPTQLVARTEPRARAFVNHQEVDVMPDGWFSALVPLYNNENEVHIRVVDVVGHENFTLIKVTLDTTAPALVVETPVSGHWTNRDTVTVIGTTEFGSTVDVNGIEAEMEHQRFNVPVPLEEGMNVVTVTVTDLAGNQATTTLKVFRDSRAPMLDVQVPVDGCATNLPRVTVSGSVSDDNVQRVLVNNLSADLVMGHFYREVTLVPGENAITVVASDKAGNEASDQLVVHADFVTPVVTARLKSDETTYIEHDGPVTVRGNSVFVEVQASERMELQLMGGTPLVIGPGRHTEEVFLEPGRNEISVRGRDVVGNEAEPVTLVVYHDSIPPDLTVHAAKDVVYSTSPSFLVSGVTEPGCQVIVDGVPAPVLLNGSFALSVQLDEGPNSVRVTSMDSVGNEAVQIIQVVLEVGEEEEPVPGWMTILAGAVLGLLAGLVAALAVTRARRGSPPPPGSPPGGPGEVPAEGPVEARTEGPPEKVRAPPPTQEAPGQLPEDPQRESDEWEMM